MPKFNTFPCAAVCVDDTCVHSCLKMPRKNDIVTVCGYDEANPTAIYLKEYPRCECGKFRVAYQEHQFEPLISDEQLVELLESVPETAVI